jgi:hypothetical protein
MKSSDCFAGIKVAAKSVIVIQENEESCIAKVVAETCDYLLPQDLSCVGYTGCGS